MDTATEEKKQRKKRKPQPGPSTSFDIDSRPMFSEDVAPEQVLRAWVTNGHVRTVRPRGGGNPYCILKVPSAEFLAAQRLLDELGPVPFDD